MIVCLDMDEVLDPSCTKEWLLAAPLDAYHVFVVDLWNDPQHYRPDSCFWNVRIWRWNGETKFKAKPVHCGLAPEWTYHYHRHAPFILKHKGLMLETDRERKIKRYEKYDPNAEHLDQKYYDMLKSMSSSPFDEAAMQEQIKEEVETYNQSKPKKQMKKKKERFAYVKNPHGMTLDIPEKHLAQTMKRKGFEWIGWADEDQDEIEEMFEDTDLGDVRVPRDPVNSRDVSAGAYQRPAADEKAEVDGLNAVDDAELTPGEEEEIFEEDGECTHCDGSGCEACDATKVPQMEGEQQADSVAGVSDAVRGEDMPTQTTGKIDPNPMPDPNKPKVDTSKTPKPAKKTATKKTVKKAATKKKK